TAAAQLGDSEAAYKAQARAVKITPSNLGLREQLEAFAGMAEAWDDLERLYGAVAEGVSDPDLARAYLVRVAAIQGQRGEIDEAAASFERMLELDPNDVEALLAMDTLFRGAERW